jgi:hypothetical protein
LGLWRWDIPFFLSEGWSDEKRKKQEESDVTQELAPPGRDGEAKS